MPLPREDADTWQVVLTGGFWAPDLPKFADWSVHLIGWQTWEHWPPTTEREPIALPGDEEGVPELWAVRVVVHHPRRVGWIEWTRWEDSDTVESRGWARAPDADLFELVAARRLVQDVRQRVGRLKGWRAMPRDEFLEALTSAVVWLRQNQRRVTQDAIVAVLQDEVGKPISKSTLQEYMRDEGPDFWGRVKSGDWPGDSTL